VSQGGLPAAFFIFADIGELAPTILSYGQTRVQRVPSMARLLAYKFADRSGALLRS